ncbi:hypothetical protein SNE40_020366 [Patella caerulea]|uniref:NXPE C-terminal domain-containing protein n=1 Tax=Patella caerulea TaxID=87958 RepID=A0AAN8GE25_PATCE
MLRFTKYGLFRCVVFLLFLFILYSARRLVFPDLNMITPKSINPGKGIKIKSQNIDETKSQQISGTKPRLCQRSELLDICSNHTDEPLDATDKICTGFSCLCFTNNPVLYPPSVTPKHPMEQLLESELELINDFPVHDYASLPDPRNAKIRILDAVVNMGDTIRIQVDLFDGYKKHITRGGDHIAGWIQGQGHSMDSETTDYNNGTYVLTFPSFWSGQSLVSIQLKHLRESRHLQYTWKRSFHNMFYHFGVYFSSNITQYTLCSFNPEIPGYKNTCNYTAANNYFPWYCGEPPSDHLLCQHIRQFHDLDFINFPATETEVKMLQQRKFIMLKKNIPILVKDSFYSTLKKIPNCSALSPRHTWNMRWPIGYFKHGEWIQTNCRINQSKTDIIKFLQNTTFHLFGDSTTRQFYQVMKEFSKCHQTTAKWTTDKWYGNSICVNAAWNFTLLWTPHEMPFGVLEIKDAERFDIASLDRTLKLASKQNQRYIILIHYYLHLRHPLSAFQHVIKRIKSILSKYPSTILNNVKLVIKGPHPFTDENCTVGFTDMIGGDFRNIMFNELKEERNRIWYLDYWDLLNSVHSESRHPTIEIVWQMLRMMFGYIIDL